MEDLLCLLIVFASIAVIGLLTWAICKIIEKINDHRLIKFMDNRPELKELINKYDELMNANCSFHNAFISPLLREEHRLRNLLATSTKCEYEDYSARIEEIKEKVKALEAENEKTNNYIEYQTLAKQYINEKLTKKEVKFLRKFGWQ